MQPQQQKFSLWYFVAVFAGLALVQAMFSRPHRQNLAYSEFKMLVKAQLVDKVIVEERSISGLFWVEGAEDVLSPETLESFSQYEEGTHDFVTTRVEDPALVSDLEAADVRFTGKMRSMFTSMLSWFVPLLLFFGLWSLLVRRMAPGASGLMAVGKSKAKVYVEEHTGVTFKDVAGIDEARAELMELVDFLKHPSRYRRLGGNIPKGALLMGPPGAGKTLLAKAVAGEAGVAFFSLTGSDFVEMFVGVGAARVRDLFTQAQARAPSIVFIDELDALGKARSTGLMAGGHDEREQTLNQLLAEMDGFDTKEGLIIMAATNRPEILDPALLRPGRFDRKIVVDRPDLEGREQILAVHCRDVGLAPEADLSAVAARTPGFVGADLANIVNEAALHAARTGKDAVDNADFDEAIDRVIAGLERKSRVMNPKEKGIVAYHEAGHALVAEFRKHADRVSKISIIPRGIAALGYTQQQPTEDRYLMTRAELLDRLDVLLGGRIAEEIVYGDVSTGAQDDLRRATDLVRHMVTEYGMTEALGLATFGDLQQPNFLNTASFAPKEYGEDTARIIDTEIRKLFVEAHHRVKETLTEQRSTLEALARILMSREVVNRDTLTELLSQAETGALTNDGSGTYAEKDPVCGMRVGRGDAAATLEHEGSTVYFCSADCRRAFAGRPDLYSSAS